MSDVPQSVLELVEKFERNIDEYKNPQYNETLIRVDRENIIPPGTKKQASSEQLLACCVSEESFLAHMATVFLQFGAHETLGKDIVPRYR